MQAEANHLQNAMVQLKGELRIMELFSAAKAALDWALFPGLNAAPLGAIAGGKLEYPNQAR